MHTQHACRFGSRPTREVDSVWYGGESSSRKHVWCALKGRLNQRRNDDNVDNSKGPYNFRNVGVPMRAMSGHAGTTCSVHHGAHTLKKRSQSPHDGHIPHPGVFDATGAVVGSLSKSILARPARMARRNTLLTTDAAGKTCCLWHQVGHVRASLCTSTQN